jgi:hypothetical protein
MTSVSLINPIVAKLVIGGNVLFGVLKTEQVRFEYFEAILIKVNALRD